MNPEEIELLVKEKCDNEFAEKIIFDAVYYNFIEESEVDAAINLLNYYSSEDEMFKASDSSSDRLLETLCSASQI